MSRAKITFFFIVSAVVLVGLFAARNNLTAAELAAQIGSIEPVKPVNAQEEEVIDEIQLSEAFGHLIGSNLEAPGFKFNMDAVIRGMRDAQAGKPSPMTEAEYEHAVQLIQKRAFEQVATKNLDDANAFLAKNKGEKGVVSLEDGKIQYRVTTKGKGAAVEAGSTPQIHYTGSYQDGIVFGTSTEGEPISLPLDQTIPGFSKGIVGMKEGEKRTVFVHPDLGYGTTGQLAPNALLIFDVEVIKAN